MDQEKTFLAAVRENRDKMFRIAMSLLHAPGGIPGGVTVIMNCEL